MLWPGNRRVATVQIVHLFRVLAQVSYDIFEVLVVLDVVRISDFFGAFPRAQGALLESH